jgi:hypothetical protein
MSEEQIPYERRLNTLDEEAKYIPILKKQLEWINWSFGLGMSDFHYEVDIWQFLNRNIDWKDSFSGWCVKHFEYVYRQGEKGFEYKYSSKQNLDHNPILILDMDKFQVSNEDVPKKLVNGCKYTLSQIWGYYKVKNNLTKLYNVPTTPTISNP